MDETTVNIIDSFVAGKAYLDEPGLAEYDAFVKRWTQNKINTEVEIINKDIDDINKKLTWI